MSNGPIRIIGAGIAGLVLGRCLLRRAIPAVIYERESFQPAVNRHTYGTTLHRSAFEPLLEILDLDETHFRRLVAVDAGLGGVGFVDSQHNNAFLRANRRRLEALLREGLDIRWEHEVAGFIPSTGSGEDIVVGFSNGVETHGRLVVGADGAHSRVRAVVSASTKFRILPYAVYKGKRRLDRAEFDTKFGAHLEGVNVIEQRVGETLLQISLNDVNDVSASISYVYSRPSRGTDPLFNPDRAPSDAKVIPEELFDEMRSLTELEPPFNTVFIAEAMRRDQLLNWLMRSVLVPKGDVHSAAASGLVLIGDAAHHGPVLGSLGACEAIKDAVALVEYISEKGDRSLQSYCQSRNVGWNEYVGTSEARLATMHGFQTSSQL